MSEKRTRSIREIIEVITLTLLFVFILRFTGQSFHTQGQSMEPSFHDGEYMLVNKVAYLFQQPQRGEVIVFHYPLDIHQDFIKRIIGVPGDTIHTTLSSVIINGQVIQEPYISQTSHYENRSWKLEPNQFFVMGDNRPDSLDSYIWGPLNRSYIVGKVVAVYWPLNAWSWINTYPEVFATVPPSS